MSNKPQWLPDIICVDGDFKQVLSRLYNIFHRDFIGSHPKLIDMEVWYDRRVKLGETYEEGFWHLITRDFAEDGNRLFDPRRAEKLPWCSPVLRNANDPVMKYWVCLEHKKLICYVWLVEFDYVVILEKQTLKPRILNGVEQPEKTVAFLKTAYHLDGEIMRHTFREKYKKRIA